MSEIIWEDPPTPTRGTDAESKYVSVLTPLMKRPGKWARISEHANVNRAGARAQYIRNKAKLPGRWELVARTVDEKGYVYARYMGPEE